MSHFSTPGKHQDSGYFMMLSGHRSGTSVENGLKWNERIQNSKIIIYWTNRFQRSVFPLSHGSWPIFLSFYIIVIFFRYCWGKTTK